MPQHPATVGEFVQYWQSMRARTMRVAQLVPESQIDWAATNGAMSFADILRHLALIERWMFTETVLGRPSRYVSHGDEHASGKGEVLQLMRQLHVDSIEQLLTLAPLDLDRKVSTPAGVPITAWKWLRAMVEHEAHHRGQLYLMLRLCGVTTPPIFGLTSEQLAATVDPGGTTLR